MDVLFDQLRHYLFLTLFLSLGIGYLVGRIRFGKFELGGIAGTLIVAVLIGPWNVQVASDATNGTRSFGAIVRTNKGDYAGGKPSTNIRGDDQGEERDQDR